MISVNFLPQTFIVSEARKRRVFRQLVLIGIVITAIGCWFAVTRVQVRQRTEMIQRAADGADAVKQRVTEMTKLQAQRSALLHQVKVQRELAQPIGHTAIIGTIAKLLPGQLSVTGLKMQTLRPKSGSTPAPPAGRAGRGQAAPSSGTGGELDQIHLELVGLSPNDREVANFVGALAAYPFFTNVKMIYSRATTIGTYEAREFQVEMDVPLDRDYHDRLQAAVIPVKGAGGEVTNAH